MKKIEDMKMIDVENLTSLELLKTHWIYTDDFEKLPKEKQEEIYKYCKLHITNDYCKENMKQIRYAVTKIYFGF